MTKFKEQIYKEYEKAKEAVQKLERKEWEEKSKLLIGTHYKCADSYGDSEEEWFFYQKLIKIDYKACIYERFEICCRGTATYNPGYRCYSMHGDVITEEEYNKEFKKFIDYIASKTIG